MEVSQVHTLVNNATAESIGDSVVLQEDLGNCVDLGTAIVNANAMDAFVRNLVNHIGKVQMVNRTYKGYAPNILMDSWEYGSVLEKIHSEMPDAEENETWELTDGASYDPNVFKAPKAFVKFFNKMTTFEIDRSIADRQVKQSFSSASQLNAFVSMLFNEVEKSLTVKNDALTMRTINNMIGETLYSTYSGGALTGAGDCKSVNLLARYNSQFSQSLTAADCLYDKEFIRFAAYQMKLTMDRIKAMSTLFNVGGAQRFTPKDMLHIVTLADFGAAADIYLQSDTFHDEYTRLVNSERVPHWQGSGTGFAFSDISKVYVTTAGNHSVQASGILGVMFDRDALGINNFNSRVNTVYNGKAEFTNYFYKRDARYFNDLNENFVVFFAA